MEKEDLKERLKQIRNEVKEKLKYEAVKLGTAAVLLSAPASSQAPNSQNDDENKYRTETLAGPKIALSIEQLKPDEVKIVPIMVNVAQKDASKPTYIFHNKAVNSQGKEIKDFANATKYSIWDVTYMREVANESNPVGVFNGYGGTMQYDFTNASSMMMYALLNPKFEHIGKKFFKKTTGFDTAFKNIENGYKEYGNFVFHAGNKSRQLMGKYLLDKTTFKKTFEKEGLDNPSQFLELQRAFASDTYTSYDKNGLNKIIQTLGKKDIKIEDVSWAIIGMWSAKHIATGGFSSINETLAGKPLEQINSEKYIDELANKFPKVFKQGSGKLAYNFAKKHFKEPRSIATMYELSLMTENPKIYEDYLKLLSPYQDKTISFEQATAIAAGNSQEITVDSEIAQLRNGKCIPNDADMRLSEEKLLSPAQQKYLMDRKFIR